MYAQSKRKPLKIYKEINCQQLGMNLEHERHSCHQHDTCSFYANYENNANDNNILLKQQQGQQQQRQRRQLRRRQPQLQQVQQMFFMRIASR